MARNVEFDKLRDYCADDVHILCNLYRKQHLPNPRSSDVINLAGGAGGVRPKCKSGVLQNYSMQIFAIFAKTVLNPN